MADADDVSEESRPLPALPRFGGGRAAELAATEAPRGKMGKPGSDKPVITTMAPWAMRPGGTGAKASSRQRRAPSTWSPPEPGKAGTSPEKRSALAAPRPPPPPQAFLDSCPGLSGASAAFDLGTPDDAPLPYASPTRPPADPRARPPPSPDRDSKLRVELMTYAALFVGASPTAPSPRVVIPVFQRTYCWSDQQVLGWWRDAAMRGGHSAMRVKGGHATGRCLFRRAREGRPEERTDAGADTEGEGEDEDASPLLCLDGQQRCTTTLLAVAAIRDAALTLLAHDADVEDDTRTRTVVERAERALYADAAGARRWIRARVAEKSDDDASYPEGARPPFATTLLPSFVDRAAFFRCIVGGALAFARGERSPRSPGSRSRSRDDDRRRRCVARRRSTPRRRLFWFRAPRRRFVWRRRSTRCSRRRV